MGCCRKEDECYPGHAGCDYDLERWRDADGRFTTGPTSLMHLSDLFLALSLARSPMSRVMIGFIPLNSRSPMSRITP